MLGTFSLLPALSSHSLFLDTKNYSTGARYTYFACSGFTSNAGHQWASLLLLYSRLSAIRLEWQHQTGIPRLKKSVQSCLQPFVSGGRFDGSDFETTQQPKTGTGDHGDDRSLASHIRRSKDINLAEKHGIITKRRGDNKTWRTRRLRVNN